MSTITAKIADGIDLATSKDIPELGDFWIDSKTNNGKIGDGKTPMFELPWVSVDLSNKPPRKYKMSDKVKSFIEQQIDLIEEHRFDEVYATATMRYSSIEFVRNFTMALLEAKINPGPYLTTVPTCIQDLLLDKVDNIDDKLYNTNNYYTYTKSEIDTKLHEVTKKMYKAMNIPAHLMTIKI